MKILFTLLVLVAGIGAGFFLRDTINSTKATQDISFEEIKYNTSPSTIVAPKAAAEGGNCGG